MVKMILKRFLQTIPTLLIVVTITFCLTRMLPGDPAVAILGVEASAEDIAAIIRAEKCSTEKNKVFLNKLIYGGN